MRSALGIFGLAAGAIVIALVGRYGYVTSDTMLDGAITAFFFGVIAVGGIGGPAAAVHLCRTAAGWAKLWGLLAGLIAIVALGANLSNSLGAIAGRADKTIAERANVKETAKDTRDEIKRLVALRTELPTFTPASADDVEAARHAVKAAEKATGAECGDGSNSKQRGPKCREKEAEETTKRDGLAAALTNKGLTDTATKLDADAAALRQKLGGLPAVSAVNPIAETLARVFHLETDEAATWQQLATVVVVELLIAFSLIAWELLAKGAPPAVVPASEGANSQLPETEPASTTDRHANTKSVDSVGRFMLACLSRAAGEQTNLSAIYTRYMRWCSEQSPAIDGRSAGEFANEFAARCDRLGIRTRREKRSVWCLDVKLAG